MGCGSVAFTQQSRTATELKSETVEVLNSVGYAVSAFSRLRGNVEDPHPHLSVQRRNSRVGAPVGHIEIPTDFIGFCNA